MRLKAGDKIFLMNFEEAYNYVERNPVLSDRANEKMVLGIGKYEYNSIASRNPHTVKRATGAEFQLENEPFVYEHWMIKRKANNHIELNDNLFEME